MAHYLSAQEACDRLGIKEATLYAYVSRGLIRSEVESLASRKRRYLAEDVEKLLERKEQRRDPARVVEDALYWGVPLLESSLTLIADHHLYFRGYDSAVLAREQSFESVAALLWLDDLAAAADLFDGQSAPSIDYAALAAFNLPPIPALQIALSLAAAQDFAAYDLTLPAVARTGARILQLMTTALTGTTPPTAATGIAQTLAAAWSTDAADLLNAALVLCADHELNVSSFTARVVASAESNPYAVVQAGLAAIQGFKHGGHTTRVTALMREVGHIERVQQTIGERLRRGDDLPGFGHRLYPEGDPRAHALLDLLTTRYPDSPALALAQAIVRSVADITGKQPTIDMALAALEHTLALPDGASLTLFALGRTVGWIGHAIEQYTASDIIRPRARYTGRPPTP